MHEMNKIMKLVREGVSFSWRFDYPKAPELGDLRGTFYTNEVEKISFLTQKFAEQALYNDNRVTYMVEGELVKIYW